MAVGLHAPVARSLQPVAGCELGWAQAGIRKAGRKDLLLIRLADRAAAAGVFTRNRFCAAPVQVCRAHLGAGVPIRAVLIRPDMATLLAFVATDAHVAPGILPELTRRAADASFNRITVDGDMSTNDSFVVVATGRGDAQPIARLDDARCGALERAIGEVAHELALAIVRDGEGASKFI